MDKWYQTVSYTFVLQIIKKYIFIFLTYHFIPEFTLCWLKNLTIYVFESCQQYISYFVCNLVKQFHQSKCYVSFSAQTAETRDRKSLFISKATTSFSVCCVFVSVSVCVLLCTFCVRSMQKQAFVVFPFGKTQLLITDLDEKLPKASFFLIILIDLLVIWKNYLN